MKKFNPAFIKTKMEHTYAIEIRLQSELPFPWVRAYTYVPCYCKACLDELSWAGVPVNFEVIHLGIPARPVLAPYYLN